MARVHTCMGRTEKRRVDRRRVPTERRRVARSLEVRADGRAWRVLEPCGVNGLIGGQRGALRRCDRTLWRPSANALCRRCRRGFSSAVRHCRKVCRALRWPSLCFRACVQCTLRVRVLIAHCTSVYPSRRSALWVGLAKG